MPNSPQAFGFGDHGLNSAGATIRKASFRKMVMGRFRGLRPGEIETSRPKDLCSGTIVFADQLRLAYRLSSGEPSVHGLYSVDQLIRRPPQVFRNYWLADRFSTFKRPK